MLDYLTSDEVKAEELAMLVEFDCFCRREGLRYSLAGGTLLGAVRHGGFIPWDDDIDISMPRPDFDKLIALSHAGRLPKNRLLEPFSGDWEHPVFLKFVNQDIAIDAHYENGVGRLWIDVLPVDGLPSGDVELSRVYGGAARLRSLILLCRADPQHGKTGLKRLLKPVLVPLFNRLGLYSNAIKKLDSLGRQIKFGRTQEVGIVTWGLYGVGERYPISGWHVMNHLKFEGREFPVISCWDEYLHGIYGDYMQLPPVEKRITHEMKAWRID